MQRPRTGSVGRLRVSNNGSFGLSSLSGSVPSDSSQLGSVHLRPSTASALSAQTSLEDRARLLLSRRPVRSRTLGAVEGSVIRDYDTVRAEMMRASLRKLQTLAVSRFGSIRNMVAAVSLFVFW